MTLNFIKIFYKSFNLIKYNMVLIIPLLSFFLIVGVILLPTSYSANSLFFTLLAIIGITSVFLAGWLNMFKNSLSILKYENIPGEEKTIHSLNLFKEFFPGVGQYFGKIALGILIYLFIFNFFMMVFELIALPFLGQFESFSPNDLRTVINNPEDAVNFFKNLPATDKNKLLTLGIAELFISILFSYLTMFWAQLIVLKDKTPFNSIINSAKIAIKGIWVTLPIYLTLIAGILLILFTASISPANPIINLMVIIMMVYIIVYYLMMTFLYLEYKE